ncbi:hypothetical protein QQZ08_005086 [Neonectria magnoliae]|uniref:Uncharacterized protein n=1 Tax=Neonectria magnoliae TaxID=2732573 RepID=A0ABR1I6A5_9HYPO
MSSPRDKTAILNYAKRLSIYDKESNVEFRPAPVAETIHDIRGRESDFKADSHGLQVCRQETKVRDWVSKDVIETQYYAEMDPLLKTELESVDETFFYDWRRPRKNIPFKNKMSLQGGPQRPKPSVRATHQYHLNLHPPDLSLLGVIKRVRYHMGDRADTLLKGRVQAFNVWRPISDYPVQDRPLALCDDASVHDSDLLPTDHIKKAYIGQTSNLMYRPGFRWHYLSNQTKEECFIFKIDIPNGTPPRKSFEIRALVFMYPQEIPYVGHLGFDPPRAQ